MLRMGQITAITSSGASWDTQVEAVAAFLSHRPLETQRVLSREIGSQEATRVVASLAKHQSKRSGS